MPLEFLDFRVVVRQLEMKLVGQGNRYGQGWYDSLHRTVNDVYEEIIVAAQWKRWSAEC